MPLAIHFARRSLLGVPPILHWLQKFLLQLRVLKTLSVRTLPTMKRQWLSAEGERMHSESQRCIEQLYSRELTPASRLGALRSRSGFSRRGPMRISIRSLSRLWLMKQQGRRSFLFCCVCGSEERIKQKAAPKDPFRIAADKISFGDAADIYQCFKIGNFYFIFALDIQLFGW